MAGKDERGDFFFDFVIADHVFFHKVASTEGAFVAAKGGFVLLLRCDGVVDAGLAEDVIAYRELDRSGEDHLTDKTGVVHFWIICGVVHLLLSYSHKEN